MFVNKILYQKEKTKYFLSHILTICPFYSIILLGAENEKEECAKFN